MDPTSFHSPWIRRTRVLTQALIISGTLNISLLTTFIYFVLKEKNNSSTFEISALEVKPGTPTPPPLTNENIARAYSQMPLSDLLIRLEDKELVEEGFTKRDLSLACLVAFHHFNLERALGGLVLQKRLISFRNDGEGGEVVDLTLFPGLADYQFQAIIRYAKTEKWPLTSQGLFYEIKRSKSPRDPSLLEAFSFTPEFNVVTTLFSRSGCPLSKEMLIDLLVEAEWSLLQEFTAQQKLIQDLSPNRRRAFLLVYLNYKSKTAAKLLLDTDSEFVCKRLDDQQIVGFLEMMQEKSPQLENCVKELLISPRCDAVRKKAASLLYGFAGEVLPEPYNHEFAIARFVPQAASPKGIDRPVEHKAIEKKKDGHSSPTSSPNKKKITHVIQEGDNLWKIARKYKVSVEAIKKLNRLESERLRTGKQLDIPEQTAK